MSPSDQPGTAGREAAGQKLNLSRAALLLTSSVKAATLDIVPANTLTDRRLAVPDRASRTIQIGEGRKALTLERMDKRFTV